MIVPRRNVRLSPLLWSFAAALTVAAPGSAQYLGGGNKTAGEVQVADLEAMRDKFVALAEAFPEDLYDWRPMEGVRSVREVFALIVAEGTLFPSMWDFPTPEWVADGGIGPELARVRALGKDGIVAELRRSLDHAVSLSAALEESDRARPAGFFGLDTDLGTALTLMQTDMHEHLGQLIAYARMNEIVPPWSRCPRDAVRRPRPEAPTTWGTGRATRGSRVPETP